MTDKKLFTTIDEYISTFPDDIQAILEKVRQAIQKAAPEAAETISYGIPTFNLNGKHLEAVRKGLWRRLKSIRREGEIWYNRSI